MSPVARMYVVGAVLGVLGSTTLITSVFAADTMPAATTAGSGMYAGPNADYPQVMHMAANLQVALHGCLANGQWCDVSWRGKRGWMQADVLELNGSGVITPINPGAVPTATFEFSSYWDANYKTRLWYGDRAKWKNLDGHPIQAASAGAGE